MNDFLTVRVRALENRLDGAAASHRAYFASEEFLKRSSLSTADVRDGLAVVHYLLGHIALNPRSVTETLDCLNAGVVALDLFGVKCPVPAFELPVGSVHHQAVVRAVETNMESQMFRAAQRTLKWREPKVAAGRGRQEDAVLQTLRESLRWPGREEYARDRAAAEQWYNENCARLNLKLRQVRERRNDRLAKLARAAAPSVTSWTQLLEDIAVHALVQAPDGAVHAEH